MSSSLMLLAATTPPPTPTHVRVPPSGLSPLFSLSTNDHPSPLSQLLNWPCNQTPDVSLDGVSPRTLAAALTLSLFAQDPRRHQESFQCVADEIENVHTNSTTVSLDDSNSFTGSHGDMNSTESLNQGVVVYPMRRNLRTVPQLWDEWHHIRMLVSQYGCSWIATNSDRNLYYMLKTIVDDIERGIRRQQGGKSVMEVVDEMEQRRQGRALSWLSKQIKKERAKVAGKVSKRGRPRLRSLSPASVVDVQN